MTIVVSICCPAYNDEKFIARTLESIVMQETNFEYEILIHDDASTDQTVDIIKDYKKNYPEIINLTRQNKNKGVEQVPVKEKYLFPKAKGEYIAICMGNDFWTDSFKLQKQVDFMRTHSNCSLHIHGASKVTEDEKDKSEAIIAAQKSQYLDTEHLIEDEYSFSSSSMLFKAEHIRNIPPFVYTSSDNDYPLRIWLSLKGDVYYSSEIMSAERVEENNQLLISNQEKLKEYFQKNLNWLWELNEYTDYNYNRIIRRHMLKKEFLMYMALNDLEAVKEDKYEYLYNGLTLKDKTLLYVGHYFPFTVNLKRMIQNRKTSQSK